MTDFASARRRYLAAWLPFLPSERIATPPDAQPPAPLVLVERNGNAMRIAHASQAALALGLAPGLTLADARARVPELDVRDHAPEADRALLERLADGCERYTPMVATDRADALVLDLTGCPPPHGFAARLEARGLTVRLGRGVTPDAALARARFGAVDDLGQLPVAALGVGGETVLALRRAGLRTVGDLDSRPHAPLAARFGALLVTRLDRLLEREDARISPRRAPPPIDVERRFAEPIARIDDVLTVLRDLAGDACRALGERGLGGRCFVATLFRSDGAVRRLAVESGRPLRDPQTIARLFDERVEALADPIDPGFGFDMIRLSVPSVEPLACTQLMLEGGAVNEEAIAALIDRLSTRLGRERICRYVPRNTHIPELSVRTLHAIDATELAAWPVPAPGEPALRPLHLFDPPQPIEVIAEVPDGPPRRFRWRRVQHDVIRHEGPERIAAEWWRHARVKRPTRDYYRIEDAQGRRFWIFRHGLYETETATPRWYVHGLFA